MRVFLNAGHAPDGNPDPGACGWELRECDVAADIGARVKTYLELVGEEVRLLQSDNLAWESRYMERWDKAVTDEANKWRADVFVSLHCNAANGEAHGTETCVHPCSARGKRLGNCIQRQIVDSLDTTDRGLKERPELIVLRATDMPAVLVELAFIDNDEDAELLMTRQDDFARAIARGVTDYEQML